jgi:hypothetical protein
VLLNVDHGGIDDVGNDDGPGAIVAGALAVYERAVAAAHAHSTLV